MGRENERCLRDLGHMIKMAKMAAMPIYGKTPSKIFFPRNWYVAMGTQSIIVCSNDDPMMTRPILQQGQFWKYRLLLGKRRKQWMFWKLLQPET